MNHVAVSKQEAVAFFVQDRLYFASYEVGNVVVTLQLSNVIKTLNY